MLDFCNEKNTTIPTKFQCAILKDGKIMKEPVWIVGSKVPVAYEKNILMRYFEDYGYIDPMSNVDLGDDVQILPHSALKREINDFLKANPRFAVIKEDGEFHVCPSF